jgi:trehalose-6-phosphate synthase
MQERRARESGDRWTAARLAELCRSLPELRLIIASNRAPYTRVGETWERTAGGMTALLEPLARASGATWIAGWGDSPTVEQLGFGALDLAIPAARREGFYDRFSNQTLWPLLHAVYERPRVDERDWDDYRETSREIAAQIARAADEGSAIFLQDYHLALVSRMLRSRGTRAPIAQFLHVPWPHPEALAPLPWRGELVDGLLGNDLLGFCVPGYAASFLRSARAWAGASVRRGPRAALSASGPTRVRAVPPGVDADGLAERSAAPAVEREMRRLRDRHGLERRQLLFGIDRQDYTKGVPERLRAFGRLLEREPGRRGRVVFLQIVSPSRGSIGAYARIGDECEEVAGEINQAASEPAVLLVREHVPEETVLAAYRLADACVVTPLRDGMNLVAKEFVAARSDGDGVLVLSELAGAARELAVGALVVNPYHADGVAAALARALDMAPDERRARMGALRGQVFENNVYRWAGRMVELIARPLRRGRSRV